jgi:hypothetical protein
MAKRKKGAFADIVNPEKTLGDFLTERLEDELGYDKYFIAAKLEDLGIKGDRNEDTSCPLATYLEGEGFSFCSVDSKTITVETENGVGISVKTPKPFAEFVKAFDKGEFPELDNDPIEDSWR